MRVVTFGDGILWYTVCDLSVWVSAVNVNFFFEQGFCFKRTLKIMQRSVSRILIKDYWMCQRRFWSTPPVWRGFFFVIQFSDTCYPEGLFRVQDIYAYHCGGFGQEIGGTQGRIQKIQKGVATTLASYIDTFSFTENSWKIVEKDTEKKGWPRAPLVPPLNPYSFKLEQNTFSDHCYSIAGARVTSCNISGCYWLYWSCNRTHAGAQSGTSVPWATPSSSSSKTCFLWHILKIKYREDHHR